MKISIFLMFYIIFNVYSILAQETKIDNIIAVVNNQVILNSDVDKLSFLITGDRVDAQTSIDKINFRKKVIQKLILDTLLLDAAHHMNIHVTDEQVNNTIKNIALQKNITIEQLKNNTILNDVNTLFTYNDYFNNIKKQLTIQILQDYELNQRINISEQSINHFLDKILIKNNKKNDVNISYILLPFSKETSQNIIKYKQLVANNIIKKIKNGDSFTSWYDKCMKNKIFFSVNTIPKITFLDLQKKFSHTLNIIQKGNVLGPFTEKNGIYILHINDIKNKKEKMTTEFHIQHFLIKFSPIIDHDTAKKNIFKIYNYLQNGIYSFNYFVKNFSDDVYLHDKKGDLGWMSYKLFNRKFQKILLNLKNNSISEPIESNLGWHIFKLLNTRRVDEYYQIQRNKVYRFLFNRQMILERNNWISELKRLSYVHILHS